MLFSLIVTLAIGVCTIIILFYKYWFGYWKRQGLEYLPPSFPFGNAGQLFKQKLSFGQQFSEFYQQFKAKNLKHGGVYFFARPFYIPIEPEIIKNMLIKDFNHWQDRGFYLNEEDDPLSGHLFILEGAKWKNLRAKLTATFTSGKMKMMFETMALVAEEMNTVLEKISDKPVDIKEILARFSTDIISSCAFGLDVDCLNNPDVEIRRYGKRFLENTTWENLKNLIGFLIPSHILQKVRFRFNKQDVEDFIMDLVRKTVEYRERNNVYRKDFLHLLLQLKNRGKLSDDQSIVDENGASNNGVLNMQELTAQVFVFYIAGFETSSTTMTFALYELSKNQEIQEKLRKEIQQVLATYDGQITYDAIAEMKYLDKVVNETLRKHPAISFLNRKCTQDYSVPGTDIILKKGTMSVISVSGLQNDPDFFPNPEQFDPERFSEESKATRPAITHIPFGDGPRNCIGIRFGLLQTKIGLITMLKNYKIRLNPQTVEPLVVDTKTFISGLTSTIYLDLNKIN